MYKRNNKAPSCEQSDLVPSCTSSSGSLPIPASSERTGHSYPEHTDTRILATTRLALTNIIQVQENVGTRVPEYQTFTGFTSARGRMTAPGLSINQSKSHFLGCPTIRALWCRT